MAKRAYEQDSRGNHQAAAGQKPATVSSPWAPGQPTGGRAQGALLYSTFGLRVLPHYGLVGSGAVATCFCPAGAACPSPGAHLLDGVELADATSDVVTIEHWWEEHHEANIGVAPGTGSGLAVLRFSEDHLPPTLGPLVTEALVSGAPMVHHPDGWTDIYFAFAGVARAAGARAPGLQLLLDGDVALAPPSRVAGQVLSFETNLPDELPPLPWSLPELKALMEAHAPTAPTVAAHTLYSGTSNRTTGTWEASFDRLSEIEPEPVRWFIHERIPRGELCLLSGPGGRGKSIVSIDLSARVSRGQASPLDDGPMKQGAVLLMGREDRLAQTVRPRVDAAGGDPGQILSLNDVKRGSQVRQLRIPDDIEAIERLCEAENVQLVVIDPIADVIPGINPNSEQDVRAALLPLSELAHRLDLTVILIRHVTKAGGARSLERALGSVAFGNVVRAGVEIVESEGRLALRPTKGNLARPGVPDLLFEIETVQGLAGQPVPRVKWLGEHTAPATTKARSKLELAEDFLRDLLRNGAVAAGDGNAVAKKEGIASRTLSNAKKSLGVVTAPASGPHARWSLPEGSCITSDALGDVEDAGMSADTAEAAQ